MNAAKLRPCVFEFDGKDEEGTEYYLCVTHDSTAMGSYFPCGACPDCPTCGRVVGYCDTYREGGYECRERP